MIPERQAAVDALIERYFTRHGADRSSDSKRSHGRNTNGAHSNGTTSKTPTDETPGAGSDDATTQLVAAARQRFGKKFDALFIDGKYAKSHSDADYWLALMFARVGATFKQIVKLVGDSALAREKWWSPRGDSETYGEQTVRRALEAHARDGEEGTESTPSDPPRKSAATQLSELIAELNVELFCDDARVAYARVRVEEHLETHQLGSREFRAFARRLYFETFATAINGRALADALAQIEASALYHNTTHRVHLRFAARDGETYVDLCDTTWQQIRVTADGYGIIQAADSPMRFIRKQHMLPLPAPGTPDLGALRSLLTLKETDFMLVVSFMVSAMRGEGPYPVLMCLGEQGTAKSSTLSTIRGCLDPNASERRTAPRDERTLAVGAAGNAVVSYDNLSYLSDDLSDALCRLSTGGGLSERKLYSDDEEVVFTHMRPVIITAITEIVRRGDLLDRAIPVLLEPISEETRIEDAQYRRAVEAARPHVLAALLEGVVCAHRNLEATRREQTDLPRMADFFLWSCAAAPAFGFSASAFAEAYRDVRDDAHETAIEGSLLAQTVLTFWEQKKPFWEGTAAALLAALEAIADEPARKNKSWPTSPIALSNQLKRLGPHLRDAYGIAIDRTRTKDRKRHRLLQLVTRSEKNRPHRPQGAGAPEKPNSDGLYASQDMPDDSRPQSSESTRQSSANSWERA